MAKAIITFTDPTTRVDGTPLQPSDIASVDIFDHGDLSTDLIGTVLGGVGTFTTDVLAVGNHAFYMVNRDTTGHSSAPSPVATLTIEATLADPSPSTNVKAVRID